MGLLKKVCFIILILVFYTFLFCKKSTLESENNLLFQQLKQVINVPWELNSVIIENQYIDISQYEPFILSIGDSAVLGHDGCNIFGGTINVVQDTLLSIDIFHMTEVACDNLNIFPYNHLLYPLKIVIEDTNLFLSKNDTVYIYTSKYVQHIANYSFIEKEWELKYSNDPNFQLIDSLNLLPTLQMKINREFSIKWFFEPENPAFESNDRRGIFGIGEGMTIRFCSFFGAYAHPPGLSGLKDIEFVYRILDSSTFVVNDSTISLYRNSDNLYYQFENKANSH